MVAREKKANQCQDKKKSPALPTTIIFLELCCLFYTSAALTLYIPQVSGKWRNLSLHTALGFELSEDSLPSLCVWTDALWMSEVLLYFAAGTHHHLFNFPRLHQSKFSWIFIIKNQKKKIAKKKNNPAELFQSNQTKEIIRIYVWALTAQPDKANSVGMWSQCQADLWKVLWNPVCWQERVCVCVQQWWKKYRGAQTICFASWDFPAMASSAFHVMHQMWSATWHSLVK